MGDSFVPAFLTGVQLGLESGNKQIDPKTGQPITSKKGAIGVAQVMPDTAPEAAKLAGLPWDPQKYKYDRDYNMRLGDAYQGHLNEVFKGDKAAATAAYHSGPGTVQKLQSQYGSSWAAHLGPKGKQYLKVTLGIDADNMVDTKQSYYGTGSQAGSLIDRTAAALGTPLQEYKPGEPGANEGSVGDSAPPVDQRDLMGRAGQAVSDSDRYTGFLRDAVDPLIQNQAAVLDRTKAIVGVKRNIVNDFANREADLESKIRPLMAKREQIAAKLEALDSMNPLDRRFKAIFNPNEYDPRMLRGQLERTESAIGVYESNYKELNGLRAGVAAASVDAETADIGLLNTAAQNTLSQAQLYGQVAGAVKQNVADHLFPLQSHVNVLQLQEATKRSLLGRLTTEKTVSLFQQAQSSPDGTVTLDGVKLTVGELQDAARQAQGQDITFRNMVNAFKTGDLETSRAMESDYIDHMSPEQITEALKNQGQIVGADGKPYQLSVTHLTTALEASTRLRDNQVSEVIKNTAVGLAGGLVKQLGSQVQFSGQRAKEMFGNLPGEYQNYLNGFTTQIQAWTKGLNEANQRGVGKEYIASTSGSLDALQKGLDGTIKTIADKWGGGKAELSAVADSYLRGNPISGDAALKGLVVIARSGMPAGSQLTGPAAQAMAVARATVQEWDHPQAGDSLDALLKGGSKKETDLQRLVQQRVSAVYADSMADSIIKDLPQLSRSVRDPNDPNKLHPFTRVSSEDFRMAVAHGDSSAYQVLGEKMGVDAATAKRIFSSGTESDEWKAVASKKGYNNDTFNQLYQTLQATQMAETISALDASHSSAPGFSAGKAYVDFLQTPEVRNRVKQAAQSYGASSFGSFLLSSSAGGGFADAWDGYADSMSAVYMQQHSKELRNRINQQRSIGGDPWVRVNAVTRAAGLSQQESSYLLQHIKPLVAINNASDSSLLGTGQLAGSLIQNRDAGNFDSISNVLRNQQLDDPVAEKLRKKVATQWDTMSALTGTILDSVNE
jgi:hypothetical protein